MTYYDDTEFSYDQFWVGRQYEHRSEILALNRLIGHKKIKVAVDIGGGFGRLTKWLAAHSQKVYLVEPSAKMRQAGKKYLAKYPRVGIWPGKAEDADLPSRYADLVMMVRVLHHLPNPTAALVESRRILKPRGLLVLEFANSLHILARFNSWLTGKPILLIPVERRGVENIAAGTIPFVNHHPVTMQKLLVRQGFKVLQILSVSNFRSPLLKKFVPISALLVLESIFQSLLSSIYFGPSIFIVAQKTRFSSIDK